MFNEAELKNIAERFSKKLADFIQKESPPVGVVLLGTLSIAYYAVSLILQEIIEANKTIADMSEEDKNKSREYTRKLEDLSVSIKQLLG